MYRKLIKTKRGSGRGNPVLWLEFEVKIIERSPGSAGREAHKKKRVIRNEPMLCSVYKQYALCSMPG